MTVYRFSHYYSRLSYFYGVKTELGFLNKANLTSAATQKLRITNWLNYNVAFINCGAITFWLGDEAIQSWYESSSLSSRGRPLLCSDLAITTDLVIKRVFQLTLRS